MFLAFFGVSMIWKLCIFQTIRKLWSNHIWRQFWFLRCQKLHLQPLLLNFSRLVSKLWKIWSINYYILKMPRHTNIVYIEKDLVLTYIERFISTVFNCFFGYICWLVNCMSWVSKFNNFFLTFTETEAKFIFEGFNIALYGKFISDSPIFFLFFYLVCKLFKGLCQSVNCMSWVFESWNIPRRCHVT